MQIQVPDGDEFLEDVVEQLYEAFSGGVNYGSEKVWRRSWTNSLKRVTSFGVQKNKELDWDTWLTACYPECTIYLVDDGKLVGFSIFNSYEGMGRKHIDRHSLQFQASLELQSLGEVTEETYAAMHKQRTELLSTYHDEVDDFDLILDQPYNPHSLRELSLDDQYLFYLVVDKAYRGEGYGTLLVEETCKRAVGKGARQLFSHASNTASLRCHKKAGFESILYIEPFYPNMEGTTFMGCDLTRVIRDE